jgi:hypothetical protein
VLSAYVTDFTTKSDALQPASLDTTLADHACRIKDYFTVNVTDYNIIARDYCSELGQTPTKENRDCRIGDDANEAVMDQLAYMACMDYSANTFECTNPEGGPRKLPIPRSPSWLVVALKFNVLDACSYD